MFGYYVCMVKWSHREQSVSKFLAGYETCDPWSTILLMLIVGVYKRVRTEGYFREYLQCASLLSPSKLSKSFLSHRDWFRLWNWTYLLVHVTLHCLFPVLNFGNYSITVWHVELDNDLGTQQIIASYYRFGSSIINTVNPITSTVQTHESK